MTMFKRIAVAYTAVGAILLGPAAPVSADLGDDTPMADVVCNTLDNDPSVAGVRRMMVNFTGFMINRNLAWEQIVNGMAQKCPRHADLLKQYAQFYGYH
ncbi:hypothetical protein JF714_15590 [Mycobacterium avium]|uniref:hypothetical protein n=1 Tax=Mycobacterium avium TaxID=1764 RepID=UPI001CDAAC3D|nr:hypothetical protein [Mycobacterium avium]MCA2331865.1 hypothetical protein [Mycobacterium avium]